MWITNKENCYFSCYRRISRDTFVLTLWAIARILEAKIGSSQWENVEHKRKRNKNQEGKSENHFICDLIVLFKKTPLSLLHFGLNNFEEKHLFRLPLCMILPKRKRKRVISFNPWGQKFRNDFASLST